MSSLRPNPVKSTPLRDQMMRQMQLHRLSPLTQRSYAQAITDLAKYYWRKPDRRAPDQLTPDECESYDITSEPISTIYLRSESLPLAPAMSRPRRSVFSMSRPSAGPLSNSTYPLAPTSNAYPRCSVSKPLSISLPPSPIPNTGPY